MTSKNQINLPLVVVSLLLVGAGMFLLGRAFAPPNNPSSTPEKSTVVSTAEHEEHAEGDEHNDEHADDHGHSEQENITFTSDALKSAKIKIAPVALVPQFSGMPFNGTIEASPDNVARVASVVPGRVVRLYASIGQYVRQGQTLATVESRSVGEAQSAYNQAIARLQNARSNYNVVRNQARAGVFARGPVETAKRAQAEAVADVRASESVLRQARVALDNVNRLAQTGSFARPALEAAQNQQAAAQEKLTTAEAAHNSALAAIQSAQAELERRQQIAAQGGYNSRPVEEAKRVLVAAQSARGAAQSEVATTRANLHRAKALAVEGLISTRDLEAAQNAFETATARLETTQADEKTAAQDLERQQKLASTNVAATAEVQEAQARLTTAQSAERTSRAEVTRARESLRLAESALKREQAVFEGNIANRREVFTVRANVENAANALSKARQNLALADAVLRRETNILRLNIYNTAQEQTARASLVSAQADLNAAQTALRLLKSAPNGSAIVPIRAPLSGIVQERDLAQGEVITAEQNLMTIVNLSTVHVDMNLPERDINRVRVGSSVVVKADAVPGRTFSGRIELIHTRLDPKTRTIEAHAELANPFIAGNYLLKPGMFARGTISTGSGALAVQVPADAVQDLEGKRVVFVTGEKAGTFEPREVETGPTTNGRTIIKSGLNAGEKIVVQGAFMVKAQAMKAELGHEH